MHRKNFLASLAGIPAFASASLATSNAGAPATNPDTNAAGIAGEVPGQAAPPPPKKLKTSLNAFSFNDPLLAGKMTISDMLDFCAEVGFEGVDITGYYFTGYPNVPADDYLYGIKRKAFRLGIGISGTGVRNDFTIADPSRRAEEVKLVKNWIEAAARLGAPVLRIFAGNQKNEGISKETVTEWMLKDIRQCVDYGKQHGVVIGLQNHNDFIQTARQVTDIIRQIDSEWLGLILDTGSYRVLNPYEEIGTSLNYTVNWQIKEKIFENGAEVDTDVDKIVEMIKASPYHGYLPIETLGQGEPKVKIMAMLAKLQNAIG
ncbi:MAG TPA: sugar phosphate isomerase/epimerase family protein [Puia sp.]|jgi:sugar phosphate isomerase/epimerase|nr:sugar phosphate isomerase/epimerase family protein [Puia sp.]